MKLDAVPPFSVRERDAIARLLTSMNVVPDEQPNAYASAWTRAAAREAVDAEDGDAEDGYALSPRSTRGATRA